MMVHFSPPVNHPLYVREVLLPPHVVGGTVLVREDHRVHAPLALDDICQTVHMETQSLSTT